jgi:hypothetical protein
MSAVRSWATRGKKRYLAVLATLALFTTVGFGVQQANAAAYFSGVHTVCAETLTVYDNGAVTVLNHGDLFFIGYTADHGTHVHGTGWDLSANELSYGWVYNGYFC